MNNIFGINVHTSTNTALTEKPKQTLSKDVQVSDSFRADFDNWLLEFFGTEQCAYMIGSNNMVLNKQVLDDLIDKYDFLIPDKNPLYDFINPYNCKFKL